MRYFVIGPNDEQYGPADVPTLNAWVLEGRVTPTTTLQEENGGARFAASMLNGLTFPGSYVRPGPDMAGVHAGAADMKNAWIYGIIGFFCCGIILGPVGLSYALKAKQKGHPQAVGGIILCSISTALSVVWIGIKVLTFR